MTTSNTFRGVSSFSAADLNRRAQTGIVLLAFLSFLWVQSIYAQEIVPGGAVPGIQPQPQLLLPGLPDVPVLEPGGLAGGLVPAIPGLPGVPAPADNETCGTMGRHQMLLDRHPGYRQERIDLEQFTEAYRDKRMENGSVVRPEIVVIPVVVHVVYNTPAENISMEQIQSQIDVLNEDFRKLNADASLVPAVFQPVAADARIQFCLAKRSPDCQPTTGVTRRMSKVSCFDYYADVEAVKYTDLGGTDAWPRDEYLNLWVADLCGTINGYGQFPGAAADTDGVVVDPTCFGTTGTAAAPYTLGRVTTHEVGHWFNLYHIFQGGCAGNTAETCSTAGDLCCDTPPSSGKNWGCDPLSTDTCIETPTNEVDMLVNFMSYQDDSCQYMFSADQAVRMDATLFGFRSPLLESQGCVPPTNVPGPDLWAQDTPDDIGEEPNTISSKFWKSQDIWVREQNDGFINQHHQNPLYRANGNDNYVYVRVRNRGCDASESATLRLYWAKASTGLAWPFPWDGSGNSPVPYGGQVGVQSTGSVAANGTVILEFPWGPPNPSDYSSFGNDKSHFCLLARIETSPVAPFGMTFPEGSGLKTNVKNNNNIVWKNISVTPGSENESAEKSASVGVGDYDRNSSLMTLVFDNPEEGTGELSALDWGEVIISGSQRIYELWQRGGRVGEGVEDLGQGEILVRRSGAFLGNLRLNPGELLNLNLRFLRHQETLQTTDIFWFEVSQYADSGRLVGGESFFFVTDGKADRPVTRRERVFVRGDGNSDGTIDLTDGIIPLLFLFSGGDAPACMDAADANDSGAIEITDAIILFSWLFTGGEAPVDPSPLSSAYSDSDCDKDPTRDLIGCEQVSRVCE